MRIAFVCTHAESLGGSYVHVRDVSSALMDRGYVVKVFIGGTGIVTEQLEKRGVPFQSLRKLARPISPIRDIAAILELNLYLSEFNPSLISCHSSKAGIIGRLASVGGVPKLFTAHGWAFADGVGRKARLYEKIERLVAPRARRIITVCDADRRDAIRRRIARPEQLVTIYNGMPEASFRADVGRQPPRIISVARLDTQKDHPTLLRALAGLTRLEWSLVLVGDGPRRAELEALVVSLGIVNRVTFLGVSQTVGEELASSQIFCLSSNYEGFPRSTLEAMRTGLPVIVTDVNGCKEALVEGKTGFSVPPRDVEGLAERLSILIQRPDLRVEMGQRGRELFVERFTFERMLDEMLALYEEVLSEELA
jgi:glycosyltransferase involved in cell wall biosynthesis